MEDPFTRKFFEYLKLMKCIYSLSLEALIAYLQKQKEPMREELFVKLLRWLIETARAKKLASLSKGFYIM